MLATELTLKTEYKYQQQRRQQKSSKPKQPAPISDEDLRTAFDSALTKFDALEDWFASGANVKQVGGWVVVCCCCCCWWWW